MANEVDPASDKAGNKGGTLMPLAAIGFRCADSMKARRAKLHKQAGYTTATDSLFALIRNSPSAYLREESIYALLAANLSDKLAASFLKQGERSLYEQSVTAA